MFNYGVFRKTFLDSAASLCLTMLGLVAFVVLFVWAMMNMGTELMEFVSRFSFIKKIFEMGFGIKADGEISLNVLFAVCFTHGVVFALIWTFMISTATRVSAGEVERGTADMLLSLPVSRPEVYCSTSLVWILGALLLSFCPIAGLAIARQIFETKEPVVLSRYLPAAMNFACLNIAIGSLAALVGCISNRRGLAVGVTVSIVLSSFILNFLEPFLEFVQTIKFMSILSYFRPTDIVRTGEWPMMQMESLLIFAFATWVIGLIVFSRKDIPTG